jgi:hypothetical protein
VPFTPFSLLDPALADEQIEACLGKKVFDQWSVLDPFYRQKQIEAAIGSEVFTPLATIDDPKLWTDPLAVALGPCGYAAKAVHLDGATYLDIAALTAADSGKLAFSGWMKTPPGSFFSFLFAFDPFNNQGSYATISGPTDIPPGYLAFSFGDSGGQFVQFGAASLWPSDSAWHHLFGYADTNLATPTFTLKIDGASVSAPLTAGTGPFLQSFSGLEFSLPDNVSSGHPAPFLIADLADWWFGLGSSVTDVALFRDPGTGKPRNPSGFPAGGILFSGDHTTFGTNQGTGGAATVTGALTDASTHP